MLRVDGYYPFAGSAKPHHPLAAGDEGLLVGEGDSIAVFQGADGRGEPGKADDAVQDHVGGYLGHDGRGPGAADLLGAQAIKGTRVSAFQSYVVGSELFSLLFEGLCVAVGREADYLEAVSVGADDVEGLEADAARGAEDGEASPLGGVHRAKRT